MFPPGFTLAGPLFVTASSACAMTAVVAVAPLLAVLNSGVDVVAFAVLLIVDPLATLLLTVTTRVNVADAPAASVAAEAVTVPPDVSTNAGPVFCVNER